MTKQWTLLIRKRKDEDKMKWTISQKAIQDEEKKGKKPHNKKHCPMEGGLKSYVFIRRSLTAFEKG